MNRDGIDNVIAQSLDFDSWRMFRGALVATEYRQRIVNFGWAGSTTISRWWVYIDDSNGPRRATSNYNKPMSGCAAARNERKGADLCSSLLFQVELNDIMPGDVVDNVRFGRGDEVSELPMSVNS